VSEPEQIDELAAALRADTADLTVYARVLTNALADALPAGLVTITRDRSFGDRLAGREGTVQSLAIRLGDHEFTLHQRRGGAPKAVASQQVRGVTISSRETSLDEWIHQLAAALTDYASQSAEARDALAKLLGTT
jgi:hypothetical protein